MFHCYSYRVCPALLCPTRSARDPPSLARPRKQQIPQVTSCFRPLGLCSTDHIKTASFSLPLSLSLLSPNPHTHHIHNEASYQGRRERSLQVCILPPAQPSGKLSRAPAIASYHTDKTSYFSSVVKGGTFGTLVGLAGGTAGVLLAARRFHTIRSLTLPMKAFLVTSSGTFVGIIAADHASRNFEAQNNAEKQWYENREERLRAEEIRGLSFTDRAVAFARREKYKIVGATWIASMVGSFVLVGRNPYLSGQQKIVQARVYAQGLTLGVLCASAAFEISDQRRGRGMLDAAKKSKEQAKKETAEPQPVHRPNQDEGDLWKDMVAAEEERLKLKHQPLYQKEGEAHAEDNQESSEKESESESESEPGSKDSKKSDKAQSKGEPKSEKAPAESAKKHT